MRTHLIPLSAVDYRFPFTVASVYSGHSKGRYGWLTRVGPNGRIGKILWIDIPAFNKFCHDTGRKYRITAEDKAR